MLMIQVQHKETQTPMYIPTKIVNQRHLIQAKLQYHIKREFNHHASKRCSEKKYLSS